MPFAINETQKFSPALFGDGVKEFDPLGKTFEETQRVQNLRDKTSFSANDFRAFTDNALEDNILANGFRKASTYLEDLQYKDDEEFKKNYTGDIILNDIENYGLDFNDIPELSKAKSEEHKWRIIHDLKEDKKRLTFINETIGDNARILSSVTGMLFDVDTLMVGPIAATLGKSGKIGRVMAATTAVETGGAVAKSYMKDDYNFKEDGLLDIALGTFVDTSIAATIMGRRRLRETRESLSEAPKQDIPLLEYKPQAIITPTKEEMIQTAKELRIKERTDKITAIDEELNKVSPKTGKKVRMSKAKRAELEKQKADLEYENLKEDTLNIDEALAKIKENEVKANSPEPEFMDWMKERQRQRQVEIDKKKELEALEAKGSEARAKLETERKILEKKQKELKEKEELELKKIQDERNQKIQEGIVAQREAREQREWFTEKFNTNARKSFYRMQDEIIETAKKEEDAVKAQKIIDETRRVEKMVHELAPTVEKTLTRLGRMLQSGELEVTAFKEAFEAVKTKFPDAAKRLRKLENYINNHSVDDFDTKEIMNHMIDRHFPKLSRFQKVGLIALLTTGSAFASEDGSDNTEGTIFGSIFLAAVAFAIVPSAFNALRYSDKPALGKVSDTFKDLFKNTQDVHYMTEGRGKKLGSTIDLFTKKMSTGFNSSYKGFMNLIDKKLAGEKATFARELISKLLLNPLNGSIRTADVEKIQLVRESVQKFHTEYKAAFNLFKRKEGAGFVQGFLDSIRLERRFNNMIADMMDGTIPITDDYKKVVDEAREAFQRPIRDAKEAGVHGADKLKMESNYFPRIWKFTELKNMLNKMTKKADRDKFVEALSKGIKGTNALEKADELVKWIEKSNFNNKKNPDNLMAILDEFIDKDADLDKLKQLLAKDADKSSRLKARLDIDFSKIKFPEVTINGELKQLELDDIIDRNVRDVIDSYNNNVYGNVVMARRGYPTISQLRDDIDNIGDERIASELHFAVDMILNKPLKEELSSVGEMMEIAKGLTFVATMPLVAFSMAVEVGKTVANAGLPALLNAMRHQVKMLDKDSLAFQLLEESGGLGVHSQMSRFDFKGIEQHAADEIANWTTTQLVKKAQQGIARGSGLIGLSDITQKANYLFHIEQFAKMVNGMDNGLVKTRLDSYGITEDVLNQFKDDFKFNDKGQLLKFDRKGMSLEKRALLNDIMVRLNQEVAPEVYTGTLGLWLRTPVGKIFGFLLSYPLNLIENQAVKDFHYMDSRTLSNTVLTFAGSYLGMMAKYEALGREYDHEKLVQYSLMNLPSFALISAVRGVLDPATVSTLSNFKHDVEAITLELGK